MNKQPWLIVSLAGALALAAAPPAARAAEVVRTRYAAGQGTPQTARIVSVDKLVFPSGVVGTNADPLQQVDEVVEKLHADLGTIGLGIGNMIQHTIYIKDGALQPMQVLPRFHAAATRLAPSLKDKPSGGTIVRVPAFSDPRTAIMVDIVAAAPGKGKPDTFARVPFTYGPKEIVESVTVDNILFTAGTEAMDFKAGKMPTAIDEQIEAIIGKMAASVEKSGLTMGHMIAHNLYVTKGTDTMRVIEKFHEEARKRSPELKEKPSVGTLVVVDGMAVPGFLLEVDAVFSKPASGGHARVLFTEAPFDIAKSVAVNDVLFLAGMEGVDFSKKGALSPDVVEQVQVAVKKIDDTLRKSGLSIGSMVKHKLYVKAGQDVAKVREAFHAAAIKLAPELTNNPSAETLVVVEGLAGERLLFEASVIAARTKK